jgi:hypothetical protein
VWAPGAKSSKLSPSGPSAGLLCLPYVRFASLRVSGTAIILAAGEAAGGEGGLTAYLTRLALENSSAYVDSSQKCSQRRYPRLNLAVVRACKWSFAGKLCGLGAELKSMA